MLSWTKSQRLWAAAAFAAMAVSARAQAVFFDDFDGNALLPHWEQPPPEHWQHFVSEGFLHVERVFFPSLPKQPLNATGIFTDVSPVLSDFWLEARVGWDAGEAGAIGVSLNGPIGGTEFLGSLFYTDGQIAAKVGFANIVVPAPASGLHDFVIARTNGVIEFLVDGSSIGMGTASSAASPARISLLFREPFPQPGSGVLRVDHVVLVPNSAVVTSLAMLSPLIFRRRRS